MGDITQIPGIEAEHISKKFCRNLRSSMRYGLMDITMSTLGVRPDTTRLRRDEFWAVRDVSVSLRQGDVVGLVGPNGSGKSTLLRVLAGIFPPDNGRAEVRGRSAAVFVMGAGFHPHLTVRDNVYINGTVLGMERKEIDEKFESIMDFSGIGDFVDSPVATLSSGMYVRLGFAIAMAVEPDIYLIDEVLAVGDREFREKCIGAFGRIAGKSTILLVSHNTDFIQRVCNRIIVMQQGMVVHAGDDVAAGIAFYGSVRGPK